MIYEVRGDLLRLEPPLTHIVHQCNLFHTFGSGLALQVKKVFPEAFAADLKTPKGSKAKLGTFSKAITPSGKVIYNLYSQVGIGSKDRQTSYDAMAVGLLAIREELRKSKTPVDLGIPDHLGCGLANGEWKIVRAIIDSIFEYEDDDLNVTIVKLPDENT